METHAKNADLTGLKTEYVTWLLDPDKSPKTQKAWAEAHKVHEVTVSRWNQDEFVLALLKRANDLLEPVWARALSALVKIATDADHINCVSAIKELGKLLNKYPVEKVDLSVTNHVAYAHPGALRDVAAALERPN